MTIVRKPLLALCLMCAALFAARAQEPWADQRYQCRIPVSITNTSGRVFAAGEVVAATIPAGALGHLQRTDGADITLYSNGAALPSRTLLMGGSDKILFALPSALSIGGQLTGLYVYAGAPSVSTPPDAPAALQVFDFSDGELHGWQSLQRPGDANSVSSDIRTSAQASDVPVMAMDTGLFHHPMFFANDMAPVGDATVYASVQTRGGANEVSLFQRFNTQTLTDSNGQSYLTGANRAAAGVAIDAFGELSMLVTSPLGAPEGSDGRRHPGPSALRTGPAYTASPDNVQFMIGSTRDIGASTQINGKAWQAAWPFAPDAAPDPTPGAYQITAYVSGGSLPPGKPALMIYGTSAFVRWMVVVPNGSADAVSTTAGALELAPTPTTGQAIVQGLVYNAYRGRQYPVGGATVTIVDANDATLASYITDSTGRYRALLPATASPADISVNAVSPDGSASASASMQAEHETTADIPLTWEGRATGTVTDMDGQPVANATVGLFLDQGPYVQTDAQGHYELPIPAGTAVIGAHKDGDEMSGPRWLTPTGGAISADFTLFGAGDDFLQGNAPVITPAGGDPAASITDGSLTSAWTAGGDEISPATPLRFTWTLSDATVSQLEVHWKNPPTAWHVEMANIITNDQGGSPHLDTRVYYQAGGSAPAETGGYVAPNTNDRHVTVIKTAPVWGVKTLSIVVTGAPESGPPSLYEVKASEPQPTTLADAVAALRVASGLRPAPGDPNAFMRWNADNNDQNLTLFDALKLARAPFEEVKDLRVFIINYLPIIEDEGNMPARKLFNWYEPHYQSEQHRLDMQLASHDFLRINLLPQADVDEYSVFYNGFQFTDDTFTTAWRTRVFPSSGTDYQAIIRRFDLVRRVAVGDVDAVWIQAPPLYGMPETIMAGANAYWCNSGPVPGRNGNRLFVFTNFNYERHTDVMIHDWGHRSESILGVKVYGGWNSQSGRTTFDRFTRYDAITPGLAACGNTHWPPNALQDYDYGNPALVSSDADDWLNYPNLTGARAMVSDANWSTPRKSPDGSIDYQRNYLIWWFSHFPHIPGTAPDGKLTNWWKYVVDMNRYPESR